MVIILLNNNNGQQWLSFCFFKSGTFQEIRKNNFWFLLFLCMKKLFSLFLQFLNIFSARYRLLAVLKGEEPQDMRPNEITEKIQQTT